MTSMTSARLSWPYFLAVALWVLVSIAGAHAAETVIHQFKQTDGSQPLGALIPDGAGNLYGTTSLGGVQYEGTAFELSLNNGVWTETVLYSFNGTGDGNNPYGSLIFDQKGNLYGVAQNGQLSATGVLFQLTKGSNGQWSETIIHSFSDKEGAPNGDLIVDGAGNLYGTTAYGGSAREGEVFELSPQSDGTWKESVLFSLTSTFGLTRPTAGVTMDGKGNLYGPAGGSSNSGGGVYELSPPQGSGPWTATVLFTFNGNNGRGPNSKLLFDSTGNLYGTNQGQEDSSYGNVFELSPTSGGTWTETTIFLFSIANDGSVGLNPLGAIAFDARGNLYGTTTIGGTGCNSGSCGIAYRLTPQNGSTWKETVLHNFQSAEDGSQPQGGLFLDKAGHLFGTTKYGGGRYGYGTVFEITQ